MRQGHKGALIGEGRTADVFLWTPRSVLKLYHSWWPLANIEYEARVARMVHTVGVASPWVGEIVEVEGKHGLIYERIDGPSIRSLLYVEPTRRRELALIFAELHAALHKRISRAGDVPLGLPLQREVLEQQITVVAPHSLPSEAKDRLLDLLASLPDDTVLCHGDYHPGNVLISGSGGRTVAIDWENARLGNPLADVARTVLLLQTAPLYYPARNKLMLAGITAFLETYLLEYVALTRADPSAIEAWYVPVAAARLSEGVEIEEKYLLKICAGFSSDTDASE